MTRPNLFVNLLLEWKTDLGGQWIERLLWINPEGTEVALIRVDDPQALPVFRSRQELEMALAGVEAVVLERDPDLVQAPPEETLSARHRHLRDRAWAVIGPLVEDPERRILHPSGRGPVLNQLATTTGFTKMTLYQWLRRYWQGGQTPNALLPRFHRCGGKGKEKQISERKRGRPNKSTQVTGTPVGINVDEEVKRKFRQGIRKFYETKDGRPLLQAYHYTLEHYFHRGFELHNDVWVKVLPPAGELPTYTQFRYWYEKEKDLTRSLTRREGKRAFELRRRAVLGETTQMAFGPGSIYQIDATIADVHLVSSLDRSRLIGRPVLYLVVDVFSRMIVGFHVGLEGPDWNSARLALENAFSDKVPVCRELGIQMTAEDWPCRHLPEGLLADRSELLSRQADRLASHFNIRVLNTPPYRADWKPVVERSFRLSNDTFIHWIPGAVRARPEPGGADPRLAATLDLRQFRKLLALSILDHNQRHRMNWYRMDEFLIADQVEPYPLELWNWGMQHRTGHLRVMPLETIRRFLLTAGEASVTPRGIRFQGLSYVCDLAIREQWFVRARLEGTWKVPVIYDPRNLGTIFLNFPTEPAVEACTLLETEQMFAGRDWYEVQDYFALRHQAQEQAHSADQQAKAVFHAQVEQILTEAAGQTSPAVKEVTKNRRLRDLRKNRKAEPPEVSPLPILPAPAPTETRPDYVPPPQPIELIRQVRQKLWEDDHE
ncbi:MAG: DDE-type integrase/transposase/recombinase [Blastocatellia bacterium]|nr:DDE-type integrase/transposase/recombinase [Blastocatellia bacterium]